ncbi:MAG: hypothetical protein E6G14_11360 [Actinobacteria bacterium]|nr:MAG: hypothetical protein E6G60_13920 [Actinomycetota bacterium]TML67962.1 MAG: hypothetical protein E6G14_11360 [Actinomycetota bacterium]
MSDSEHIPPPADPDQSEEYAEIVRHRVAHVFARRLQEVEGSVAVAMALADRTGVELREELENVAESLAEQLEGVAAIARAAATAAARAQDSETPDMRFDEVHERIDAVIRELRAGEASLQRERAVLPAPYGERVALTLGRRIEQVEGAVAVASELAIRLETELKEGLDEVDTAGAERATHLAQRLSGFEERLQDVEVGGHSMENAEQALHELIHRMEEIERDRDAITAELIRTGESWTAEQIGLRERVAELAARIVTGPLPDRTGEESDDAWPTSRAFDQLRIAVEGLRMRLAYHEKTVAEIVRDRSVDDRIDEMHKLLRGLESAEQHVRSGRDHVLEQFERIAERMDRRIHQIEATGN